MRSTVGRGKRCEALPTKPLVGLEWASQIEAEILRDLAEIRLLEVIPENFFYHGDPFIDKVAASGMPVIIHGVELSLGSAEPLKEEHLAQMIAIGSRVNTVMYTEHLAMTEADGIEIGQLTPLPFTRAMAKKVGAKIRRVAEKVALPYAIENVTNRFLIPDCELSEPQFINAVVEEAGCFLQLDLNNVDTNAVNFGFDPFQWLTEIDLKRVVCIHLAGGIYDDEGTLLDSHSAHVRPRVWDMYRYVCERHVPPYTIVEWTDDTPPLAEILQDVNAANLIVQGGMA